MFVAKWKLAYPPRLEAFRSYFAIAYGPPTRFATDSIASAILE